MVQRSGSERAGSVAQVTAALRSPWPRLLLFVALLLACGWFAVTEGTAAVEAARQWAAGLGAVGVLVFMLVYAGATMTLLPAGLLSAAAGVLFGPLAGVGVVWTGAMLGAAASFAVGRGLSRRAVEELAGARIDRLNAFLKERGLVAMLLVRLVPVFPFGLVNYGSAVTAISFRQYLVGTALGILPGAVAYASLGGNLDDPTSAPFLVSVAALVVLVIGGAVVARRWSRGRDAAGAGR